LAAFPRPLLPFFFLLLLSGARSCPKPKPPNPLPTEIEQLLQRLGVPRTAYTGGELTVRSPVTGEVIAQVPQTTAVEATGAIGRAHEAFEAWRIVPAPRRGELVSLLGEELRAAKADLGRPGHPRGRQDRLRRRPAKSRR
jgi:hypothetical protein